MQASHLAERQEAQFNIARAYHLLGLVHLAVPYYIQVISDCEGSTRNSVCENIIVDAAYNLQAIYATTGNIGLADEVTKQWLEI